MGTPRKASNVRPFVTLLSADEGLFDAVKTPLVNFFGEILREGSVHSWNYSPAYSKELGSAIARQIVVFNQLREPEHLPDWKLYTIELEKSFLSPTDCTRNINIDPGYVSGSHVILASTKKYNNRIYLRDGIYGDLTLYYDGSHFQPFGSWTFPDYRTKATRRFFTEQRTHYIQSLQTEYG